MDTVHNTQDQCGKLSYQCIYRISHLELVFHMSVEQVSFLGCKFVSHTFFCSVDYPFCVFKPSVSFVQLSGIVYDLCSGDVKPDSVCFNEPV